MPVPFKVIVIDDEPLARQIVREYLQNFPKLTVLAECENGKQAVADINRLQPDLIFLDVQMPVLSGFEVLERLAQLPAIIFSTAYDEFAIRAFEVNAVDYLLKPYDRQRFATAAQRALVRCATPGPHGAEADKLLRLLQPGLPAEAFTGRLLIRRGERIVPVSVRDIDWIEAADDYTLLHVGGSRHLCNLGLSDLAKRLPPQQFVRVHRSAILNSAALRHLDKDGEGGMRAIMRSGEVVKVSRKYAAALRRLVL